MQAEEFKTKLFPLKGPLYRFARSFLPTRQEAEDCVQEIFLKLWQKKNELSSIVNLRAYTLTMTRNLCLDKLKSQRHRLSEIPDDMLTPDSNPHQQLEIRDKLERIEEIIKLLPEQQRTILHLRAIEGLEIKEISQIANMTEDYVRVSLSRARISIRQLYQKHYGEK